MREHIPRRPKSAVLAISRGCDENKRTTIETIGRSVAFHPRSQIAPIRPPPPLMPPISPSYAADHNSSHQPTDDTTTTTTRRFTEKIPSTDHHHPPLTVPPRKKQETKNIPSPKKKASFHRTHLQPTHITLHPTPQPPVRPKGRPGPYLPLGACPDPPRAVHAARIAYA